MLSGDSRRIAQSNGFKPEWKYTYTDSMGWTMVLQDEPEQQPGGLTANVTYLLSEGNIIFDHDFAKALWGEENIPNRHYYEDSGNRLYVKGVIPIWQYHLQQMVIADDPIKYLGDNLPTPRNTTDSQGGEE